MHKLRCISYTVTDPSYDLNSIPYFLFTATLGIFGRESSTLKPERFAAQPCCWQWTPSCRRVGASEQRREESHHFGSIVGPAHVCCVACIPLTCAGTDAGEQREDIPHHGAPRPPRRAQQNFCFPTLESLTTTTSTTDKDTKTP